MPNITIEGSIKESMYTTWYGGGRNNFFIIKMRIL